MKNLNVHATDFFVKLSRKQVVYWVSLRMETIWALTELILVTTKLVIFLKCT